MRLARDLGMSKTRLYAELDSDEIAEWMAYYIYCNQASEKMKKNNEQMVLQEKFKALMGGKIKKKKTG